MAIKNLIARGIGFDAGTISYIPTLGLGVLDDAVVATGSNTLVFSVSNFPGGQTVGLVLYQQAKDLQARRLGEGAECLRGCVNVHMSRITDIWHNVDRSNVDCAQQGVIFAPNGRGSIHIRPNKRQTRFVVKWTVSKRRLTAQTPTSI